MNAPMTSDQHAALQRAQRQSQVVAALKAVLPAHAVLYTPEDTTPYECDGLTAYRARPMCVALPETEAQVQAVLRTCHALQVPVVAAVAGFYVVPHLYIVTGLHLLGLFVTAMAKRGECEVTRIGNGCWVNPVDIRHAFILPDGATP